MGDCEKIEATCGTKWFRIWEYFLAYSTITARQGGLLQPLNTGSMWLEEDFVKVMPGQKNNLIRVGVINKF